MPTTVSYPGVYIEELPSQVRTITAVTTSVTAFVGRTRRGPTDTAITITSFADFERRFGGLDTDSLLSYCVQHFFLAGGSQAVIVRVAKGAKPAFVDIGPKSDEKPALKLSSLDSSEWANDLRIAVDPGTAPKTFTLRVLDASGTLLEQFRDLSLDPASPKFVDNLVTAGSSYIEVTSHGTDTPEFSGTAGGPLPPPLPDLKDKELTAVAGGETQKFKLYEGDDPAPASLVEIGLTLERKLRAASPKRAFSRATVTVAGAWLQVLAGEAGETMQLTGDAATALKFGTGKKPAEPLTTGSNGSAPGDAEFLGSEVGRTGVHALRDVQDVNLLSIPEISTDNYGGDAINVITAAEDICEDKRMLLIVDSPASWNSIDKARAGLAAFDSVRSDHAALYFPHIQLTDAVTGQLRSFPPSGMVAGVMARTDAERGVWKAPAGTEARLNGVRALTVTMTDLENGLLNPLAVNCLRTFPIVGPVVWGARTLDGADANPSQWKYVPVRRLAFMLEESLFRGLKWVVFEPNDERLWGQIRLNVGAFLHTLFTQGAFQGTSARDAYFVKCDKDTTTQDDINRGVVNVIVGFAPLKPAEFVVIKIEQMAGQIEV